MVTDKNGVGVEEVNVLRRVVEADGQQPKDEKAQCHDPLIVLAQPPDQDVHVRVLGSTTHLVEVE